MEPNPPTDEELSESRSTLEHGHAEWKRAKIERALKQAMDRTSMIPAEQVMHDFGLE